MPWYHTGPIKIRTQHFNCHLSTGEGHSAVNNYHRVPREVLNREVMSKPWLNVDAEADKKVEESKSEDVTRDNLKFCKTPCSSKAISGIAHEKVNDLGNSKGYGSPRQKQCNF